jgi:para-aminobenzoate synthetase component 1
MATSATTIERGSAARTLERGVSVVLKPVVRALPDGWTPLRALAAVEHRPYTLFLESGGPLDAGSQWTMLVFDPLWRLELRGDALWRIEGSRAERLPGSPLEALRAAWPARARYEPLPAVPFAGGLAGYLAYDFKDWIERFPAKARRGSITTRSFAGLLRRRLGVESRHGRAWASARRPRPFDAQGR